MIVTSRRMMRNAQSGASGNHTTWEIALTVTRITATHRTVELPVARQEFDGYLWTRGKNAMAGVTTLAERPFGFVAIRAGSELIPKEEE